MKNLLMSLCSLLFCTCLVAQKDFDKKTIRILPQSELIIAGSTNVNTFDCKFDIDLISSTKTIQYTVEDDHIKYYQLDLPLRSDGFDCGNRRMNSDFQDLLKSDEYPEIIIRLNRLEPVSEEYVKAFLSVKLAGQENHYDMPVHRIKDRFIGKFRMDIRDFGLEPPTKALGLIEVDPEVEVQFNLLIKD